MSIVPGATQLNSHRREYVRTATVDSHATKNIGAGDKGGFWVSPWVAYLLGCVSGVAAVLTLALCMVAGEADRRAGLK